ncbi:Ribonuclease J [Candidatus Gugararchaeum adminiculabundum]|nr:Ribonuclease J [Candidatus Gugararchaeum adminiculabundum]
MEKKVSELLPAACQFTKLEFEGPDVVVYMRSIQSFYADENLIRKLAAALRKRIIIRSDPSSLLPAEEAKKIIESVVPPEAGINNLAFNADFCEVNIEAMKPGLVIGKGGMTLKQIITRTSWTPKILRTPTMPSRTIRGVRDALIKESGDRKKFLVTLGKKISSIPAAKSDWVKVTALGGFKEVGRTCMLVQTPNDKILIDCGINPESTDAQKSFPYLNAMNLSLEQLDAVILTHAHLDHCGFIPYLYAYGYDGPIYCTPPTRDLAVLLQFDYVDILNKTPGMTCPYTKNDVRKMMSRMIVRDYEEVTDISSEIKLTFHNAGHILGSSMVHLHIGEGLHNLVYTGDMKYGFTKLFDNCHNRFPRLETLFMESTYGGANDISPKRNDAENRIGDICAEVIKKGGKVLIPVFAVGRAQELMLVLEEQFKINPNLKDVNVPVYIDGMVLEASAIHTAYPEYLKHNVQRRILSNDSPFESKIFEPVKQDRKEIVAGPPAILLAPAGMLSGGPSLEFLKMLAEDPNSALLFVGYQSSLSLGRKIQRGLKEIPTLGDDGRINTMKINLRVETVEGFSGHSDRLQLVSFAKHLSPKPERIFTCHGDETKCDDLSRALSRYLNLESRAPMNLDAIRLQ